MLPKLPGPFAQNWLSNLGNLGSNKEIRSKGTVAAEVKLFIGKFSLICPRIVNKIYTNAENHFVMNVNVEFAFWSSFNKGDSKSSNQNVHQIYHSLSWSI